jgi:hypothetical protein
MAKQLYKAGDTAAAIAPLRSLAELGDERTERLAATDLTPRLPFPVLPGWYERYWYGNRPQSRWQANRLNDWGWLPARLKVRFIGSLIDGGPDGDPVQRRAVGSFRRAS